MRAQRVHVWLAAAASGCLCLGCHNSMRCCPYPEEPLLLSKPPVEGKIEVIDGPQLSRSEPAAPPLPVDALASIPRPLPVGPAHPMLATPTVEPPRADATASAEPAPSPATPTKPPVVVAPASTKKSAVPASPVSRRREMPPAANVPRGPEIAAPVAPPQPRGTSGVFGHEASYGWLQGTVDKHYRGRLYLRYCDPTTDDRWGGKVCLEDDPRLADCRDGDVIFVEGELSGDANAVPRDGWRQYPHYRVKSMRLVQRKN